MLDSFRDKLDEKYQQLLGSKSDSAESKVKIRPNQSGLHKGVSQQLRQVDVAFVIDCTGSMGSELAEVQERIGQLALRLSKAKVGPALSFALVAYRDHPPQDNTFVTRVYPLTAAVHEITTQISSLTAQGGGDAPEAVYDGIAAALQLDWRQYSHRIIVLVGDAPPHHNCLCGIRMPQLVEQADKMGATIHAVGVRNDPQMVESFTRIAHDCRGVFVPLHAVESLIDKILGLMDVELADLEEQVDVFDRLSAGESLSDIAADKGKSSLEMEEVVGKLKKKGVPVRDSEADAILEGMTSHARESRVIIKGPPVLPAHKPSRIKIKGKGS